MSIALPRPHAPQLGGLVLLVVAALAVLTVLVGTTPAAPASSSSTDAYLVEVNRAFAVAPSYVPDVVAAGWTACGELGRGAPADALVSRYAEYGIGGDLYSRAGATAVVEAAQHALCP